MALAIALVLAAPAQMAGATSTHGKVIKVSTAKVPNVGTVLTTASGLTLYRFTDDPVGGATCTGACAKIWPPLLAAKGSHVSGPHGVKGLSLINVGNGHFQVAFHKVALYRFDADKKKGQAKGQDVGKVWFAVLKSGIPAATAAGAPAATSTTAPGASTTQPMTSTTQATHPSTGSSAGSGSGSTAPTQTPATSTPATSPPVTSPPVTSPPATSPPATSPPPPPTTTTTPAPPSGGAGF
jgi:predicted lipoprotein with Yx(FWY)xxD motif